MLAREYGISAERIRQIEAKALEHVWWYRGQVLRFAFGEHFGLHYSLSLVGRFVATGEAKDKT